MPRTSLGSWGRTALFVLLCALAALPLRNLRVDTQLQALLGAEADAQLAAAAQGPGSQLVLLGVAGGSTQQRATASHALAKRLRRDKRFVDVQNGAADSLRKVGAQLFRYRYLLLPDAAAQLQNQPLAAALNERLNELSSGLPVYDPALVAADPILAGLQLLARWQGEQAPPRQHGVWFGSGDDAPAVLVARLAPSGEALIGGRLPEVLQQHFAAARALPEQRLLMAGTPVIAARSAQIVRAEVQRLSLLATAALLALLALAYRSPRLILLAALPLAAGVLTGTAAVALVYGRIHGITLAFGITLLGVALDYPLHLFSHLRGQNPQLGGIWRTLGLSLVTTLLGYSALALTEFSGLSQLGLFAICGLATAAAVTRYLLPTWTAGVTVPRPRRLPRLRLPGPAALGTVLALGLGGLLHLLAQPEHWQHDLAALNPAPASAVAADAELRQALNAPTVNHLVLARGDTAQAALQAAERAGERLSGLQTAGVIDGFRSPAALLPSVARQRIRQQTLPPPEVLRQRLTAAASGLPFRPGTFEPFIEAVAASQALPPLTPAALAKGPLGAQLDLLLQQTQEGWQALLPLRGVAEPARLAEALQDLPAVSYIHLRQAAQTVLDRLRVEAWQRVGLGAAAILLCLGLGLRSARAALTTVLPVAAALAATAAVMLALSGGLTLFHLISLLVVAGIGIDYALFFHRRAGDVEEAERTLHGLLICVASTGLTFGLLGSAEVPVLQAIGRTVALGVVLSFLCAYLLRHRNTDADQ